MPVRTGPRSPATACKIASFLPSVCDSERSTRCTRMRRRSACRWPSHAWAMSLSGLEFSGSWNVVAASTASCVRLRIASFS